MYPSDFEPADAVVTRIDEPLFLGLPPLLALIFFLLLLAIAAGFFFFGRWHAGETGTGGDRAPEDIHKEILRASSDALGASSNDIIARAQHLRDVIWRRLGPVIELSRGVTGPLKALDEALKGEVKETPKRQPVPVDAKKGRDTDDQHAHVCRCGAPHACTCPGALPARVGPVTINQVYLGGAPVAQSAPAPTCGCVGTHRVDCGYKSEPARPEKPDPAPEPKPETRIMTRPEQIDALSRAIRQFHDHWSNGPERIRELRAARRALS